MNSLGKITLKNMVFLGSVGVAHWERETLTRLEVDVEIHAGLEKACKSDNVNDTINYSKIHARVGEIVAARHHNLLESVAQDVADGIIDMYACERVVVNVRKPHPPVGGMCDYAQVEITRFGTERR